MPLVNPRGAGLSAPVLVGLPQKETCVEKATRARGAWLQLRGDVHIRGSTPWKQISDPFNYDFPMRAIMYSCYRERMNVPYRREPPIYYSCNYILQNGLTFAYPIAKPLNADTKFPRPLTVPCKSPAPAVFSHLAHVQHLHTAQLVGCWEQIGNGISNSVPSTSCIRFTKSEQNWQSLVSLDTIH
jgi:hypothetical protein